MARQNEPLFSAIASRYSPRVSSMLVLFFGAMLIANMATALMFAGDYATYRTGAGNHSDNGIKGLRDYIYNHPPYPLFLLNGMLLGLLVLIRLEYLMPAHALLEEATRMQGRNGQISRRFKRAAKDFIAMMGHANHLARDHEALKRQLGAAQIQIGTLMDAQRKLNHGAFHETLHVFHTIQGYAHYLEDLVLVERLDETIRYDYDEVCEAAHNLQFLMQGMGMLLQFDRSGVRIGSMACEAGDMLGQFLIQITPALERRSMRITSAQFPSKLALVTHERIFRHLLWAMLYACLRYAEDDSTLNIEGRDGVERVILRFFVTHSNPASLSTGERDAYLSALTNSDHSVHMFAHALSQHPNMQLAGKLAALLDGTIDCVPQGPYCCMLELTLPKSGPRE